MERRQLILFGIVFAVVLAVLAIGYFTLVKPGYAVLYEDIREADTAEIVSVLDGQGLEYRLEDGGHRILVPEDEIGRARVLVAGSGAAMGGVVGFELFNEADMGLTEFAQKVNYQRALQGELARTIMTMEGVRFARVHLSLPERTLFRASQAAPKAAVTVQTESERALDTDRVSGIQRLVSATVTDLPAGAVAVLDHRGRLLSTAQPDEAGTTPARDEQSALEEYYRARAQGVAERLIPGVPFQLRVLAIGLGDTPPAAPSATENADGATRATGERNFRLRIAFRTESELNSEDRQLLANGISQATAIDERRGDSLRFETGQLEPVETNTIPASGPPLYAPVPQNMPAGAGGSFTERSLVDTILSSALLWPVLAVSAVFILILLRRRSRMSTEEQQSFADLLGEQLDDGERLSNGR